MEFFDRDPAEPETAADIAKAVQPQIWKDYLLILFFTLVVSVLTGGIK